MAHGDDSGLVLPPRLAPVQVVVVPFLRRPEDRARVEPALARLVDGLRAQGVRLHVDARDHVSPGAKFYEWEGKGVPLRVELGPREVERGEVVEVRRYDGRRRALSLEAFVQGVVPALEEIQRDLLVRHRAFTEARLHRCQSYAELQDVIEGDRGWVLAWWCGGAPCEARVKEQTKATIRCIPLEGEMPGAAARCIVCGEGAAERVVFARAY